ncbi:MAG: hypothetical protein J6X08_04590 [Lachnospiraceae bacterium]|nr:hypothetical protein [Lachnospiraceae bacterium]
MDIAKEFYNAVFNLKYHDIKIYNYLQTSNDNLISLADSPEKIEDVALFKGKYQGIPIYEDADLKAHSKVQGFLDSLEERDVLFFTSSQFRKEANGKMYHTVLDPYILSLSEGQYSVIECTNDNNPMFYEDVHRWNYDAVRCAYGIEKCDYKELFSFMQKEFFPHVRNILGLKLSRQVEEGITTFLFYRLCFRKAEYNFALDILRRVNPAVIMYSHGCNPCFMYLAEAAYTLGIPAVEVAHGGYVPVPYKPVGINDFYILQSAINTAISLSNGYNRLFCIGKPGFGMTKARRQIAENGPVIVLFVSSCEYGLLELAAEISNVLDPEKYTVVFRLHSGEPHPIEYLREVQEKNKHLIFSGSSEPIEAALDECDIVVGNRSTVLLETLRYKNIKVITCNLPEAPMPPANNEAFIWEKMIETGELARVSSLAELEDEVKSYHRGEFTRDSEIYWRYDGDTVFPAFIDLCVNKNDKLNMPADKETAGTVMALYEVGLIPQIDELVASETNQSTEYVGIEASDGEEELIDYIKDSTCEYITVIHPGTLHKEDAESNRLTWNNLALMSNNPYLDLTLVSTGKYEEMIKHLGSDNAVRYRNILRTGIYPLNNILDLCREESVVEGDLSECMYRKSTFLKICSLVGVHNFIKQPAKGLEGIFEKCRSLSLKAAYAQIIND